MEIWDGYHRDGTLAGVDLIRGEAVPDGLYHMVCEALVRHVDGDFLLMRRDLSKPNYGGRYEATAGGAAQKGEDRITCVRRELYEETGITAENFEEIGYCVREKSKSLFYSYFCVTDCDKTSVRLQENETIEYKWVDEAEFVSFVNSGEMIEGQKERYRAYLRRMKYLR